MEELRVEEELQFEATTRQEGLNVAGNNEGVLVIITTSDILKIRRQQPPIHSFLDVATSASWGKTTEEHFFK